MKTLKLSDTTARQLYKTADKEFKALLEENFGKEFFNASILDRIGKSDIWEFVCKEKSIDSDWLPFKSPSSKLEKHINATYRLNIISEVLNEGTKLDWKNNNQAKYYIWWERKASGWVVLFCFYFYCITLTGSGVYFKDDKTVEFVSKNKECIKIYQDYLPE